MIESLRIVSWLRCSCAALLVIGAMAAASAPLHAQETVSGARAASRNPAVATDGATLIHGNYCGAGNRPGKPPIDALDLACMNHDACSPTGGLPTCECNTRLRDEAAAVANDPRQAQELRSLASLTAAAATMVVCKPIIDAATPAAPVAAQPVTAQPVTAQPVAAAPVVAAPVEQAPVASAPLSIVPAGAAAPPEAAAPVAPAASETVIAGPKARSLP